MLRKIRTLNKTYFINWTAFDVCQLLRIQSIKAEQLVQVNQSETHKLIREFYLLAGCISLQAKGAESRDAHLLRSYAERLRQLSRDYRYLFRRNNMIDENESNLDTDASLNTIDRLQARLFYLITQYSQQPCKHIAGNIVEQLTTLCQHPHIELLPAQHYIYSQSINYWRSRLINTNANGCRQTVH